MLMKNKKLIFSIITIVVLVVAGGWFFGFKGKPNFGQGEIIIGGRVFGVEIAETVMTRAQGLSGQEKLGENEGMLFVFSVPSIQGFWMKDMKFPIDIVWIRGDKIVGFAEKVQPEPEKTVFGLTVYYSPEPVDRVLEVNAGTVARSGSKVGDLVYFNK